MAKAFLASFHIEFVTFVYFVHVLWKMKSFSSLVVRDNNGSTENARPENEGPMRDNIDQKPTDTTGKQVAQLSQRDRAAGWVSNGQKWKTGTERQYLRTI